MNHTIMKGKIALFALLLGLVACGEQPEKTPKYSSEELNLAKEAEKVDKEQKPKYVFYEELTNRKKDKESAQAEKNNTKANGTVRPSQTDDEQLTPEEERALAVQKAAEKIVAERLAEEQRQAEEAKKKAEALSIQEEAERLAAKKLAEIKAAKALEKETQSQSAVKSEEKDAEQDELEKALQAQLAKREAEQAQKAEQSKKAQAARALAEQKALAAQKASEQKQNSANKESEQPLEQSQESTASQEKESNVSQEATSEASEKVTPKKVPEKTLEEKQIEAIDKALDEIEDMPERSVQPESDYIWVDGVNVGAKSNRQPALAPSLEGLANSMGQLSHGLEQGSLKEVDLNALARQLDGLSKQAGQGMQSPEVKQLNQSLQEMSDAFNRSVQSGSVQEVDLNDLARTLEGFSQQAGQTTKAIQDAFQSGYQGQKVQ